MIELIWAWRVWFGLIQPGDVPAVLRKTVEIIVKELGECLKNS